MQKRLLLPLILPLTLTFGCTPAASDSGSTGGSPGSSTGGSGGSSSSNTGGSGSSNTGGSGSSNTGGSGSSNTGGSSGGSTGSSGGTSGGGGSSSGGGGGSSTGGAGGAAPDAAPAETGGDPPSGAPGAELDKWTFQVPCPPATLNAGKTSCNWGPDKYDPIRVVTATRKFGGDPTKTYMAKIKVCGASEERPYTGCKDTPATGSPRVCVDGTPTPGGFNITYPAVQMKVSEPAHTYFLNTGNKKDDLSLIEYSATFEFKGGSTITFETDGGSNHDVYTSKFKGHNFMCAGATGITQPFDGQFFFFALESVTPMN